MVINDLHPIGIAFQPGKADAPLIIDPDAMLPLALTLESLQSVSGGNYQIIQGSRPVKHAQFSQGHAVHLSGQLPGRFTVKKPFSLIVLKPLDHRLNI